MMDKLAFNKAEIEGSVPARFERIVNEYPERTAVKSDFFRLTYDTLNKQANRVAHAVIDRCGTDSEPIALLFDHDVPIAAAILGILKAGKAYMALDPADPTARNDYILKDLQTRLLFTDTQHFALASRLARGVGPVLNVEQLDDGLSDQNPNLPVDPHTLAGIFYTSGTTGQPKGVQRSHQFILHRIWLETNDYHIGPTDNISLIYAFSFGASVADIFDAVLNGATLSLYNVKEKGIDPLIPWLKKEEVTFFHCPTALFRQFIDILAEDDFFPKLRQITPSGRLFKKDVARIRKHVPADCVLIQRMASTETGMITQFRISHQTVLTSNIVPVGYAVEDKEVHIVDDAGHPLGFNRVGEIAVKSRYLASGYWRQPELTQKSFLSDPDGGEKSIYRLGDLGRMRPDGCLELLGRKDSQVKIRGYRVELGEIEAALQDLDQVKEAVVMAQAQPAGDKRLVAYVVPAGQSKLTATGLRSALVEKLPDYMIPALFVTLDRLPLTNRNKLDRSALPEPGQARPELDELFAAPQTPTEKTLAGIWSEVLNIEPIGVNDNFFDLGGQSLLAAQIISRTRTAFQIEIALCSLFYKPTIAAFAIAVEGAESTGTQHGKEYLDGALRMLGAT
jgi:amino acid adenylation domain-containing protein